MNVQDNKKAESALHHAVDLFSLHAIVSLLDKGADITLTTKNGLTSVHKAALRGSSAVVSILLER